MKVSVVMTTYNGKRFIKEMLNSLRNQTRGIDELLIYDDQSTDGTPQFIEEYKLLLLRKIPIFCFWFPDFMHSANMAEK